MASQDSYGARASLVVAGQSLDYFRLAAVPGSERLPFALKVLLENLLRTEDGVSVTRAHVEALRSWDPLATPVDEIQFTPARVIMQDFTGVPCVVDLAAMREAVADLGGDPGRINPLAPAELVIDHSVIADFAGTPDALDRNVDLEYRRNHERYQFLKWGQGAFRGFRVVPPGMGIVHQVNIERLARVVMTRDGVAFPDTCVGTDSHTTMVNGLGVVGWGVGGIEAEAAMLGQPVSMLIPQVVGFRLVGDLPGNATATDLVLTITERLRELGVVGKFVEFFGEGVASVPLANRATIGNMSPEYGSTVAIFPIDAATIDYLRETGRAPEQLVLIETYAREQGLWHDPSHEPEYSAVVELDLATVVPSIAGPRRPQDRIKLGRAKEAFRASLPAFAGEPAPTDVVLADGEHVTLDHGAVVVAAITSCTNTSNPSVMLAAGLLARNAARRGMRSKPWVKTTLAPGSQVVTDYYDRAGLTDSLEALGFYLVGYGCTTCIGNSGPLPTEVSAAVNDADIAAVAVLSGNRNFEGRINPDVKMNYLASPPLVVAYALAGSMDIDLEHEPVGLDGEGNPVYLREIWPTREEIDDAVRSAIAPEMFEDRYEHVFAGDRRWQDLSTPAGDLFAWDPESTYVRRPPYFDGMRREAAPVADVHGARVLAYLGDSVTTDHISPAGSIKADGPAGKYLAAHGVDQQDFNSFGSRRGNHEVMIRGTFANIRLRNKLVPEVVGGFTRDFSDPEAPVATIFDAAQSYAAAGTPLVVLAGREYGTGSSRDWAAKGTALLGVKVVIAVSFERIHRANPLGMGGRPVVFPPGAGAAAGAAGGTETFDVVGIEELNRGLTPRTVHVVAAAPDGSTTEFDALVRIDTPGEADYFRSGGILPFVLRSLLG